MKMPSINVVFKEKGITAIARSDRGIVLLILKEETLPTQTEYNLYTVDDIPVELSEANQEQLQLALFCQGDKVQKDAAQEDPSVYHGNRSTCKRG